MARYKYLPMEYKDYLKDYLNSLKTGELLVDLDDYDVYVTEEGFNLPVPTTKELREAIISFLEEDLEGIKFRTKTIPNLSKELWSIKEAIENNQAHLSAQLHAGDMLEANLRQKNVFVTKITKDNVNHLGDLEINTDTRLLNLDKRYDEINDLVAEFNRLNTNSTSVLFSQNATQQNRDLQDLWSTIQALMNEANKKLDNLGKFQGSIELSQRETIRRTVYDIEYSRRLYNWSNWWSINSESQYINSCKRLEPYFTRWLKGQAYQDIKWHDMRTRGQGTGLFYKNFPEKYNHASSNTRASNHNAWDLFEAVPERELHDIQVGYNINYIKSFPNMQHIGINDPGTYASESSFTHRLRGPQTSKGSRFNWSNTKWGGPWVRNGYWAYTDDALLNRISTVDSTGMQRLPKSTKANGRNGVFSNQLPSIPTITRAVRYVSSTGIRNADGLVIRLGCKKTINTTKLNYAKINFVDGKGWS